METPKKSARRMAGPPSIYLRAMRYVYTHPKSKGEPPFLKMYRAILKQSPRRFVALLVRMEVEHLADCLKGSRTHGNTKRSA